jgi:Prokaryotic dksA/traR C4-type zinc finger
MATKKTASPRTSARSSARMPAAALAGKRITARDLRGFRQRLERELRVLCGHRDGLEAASASGLQEQLGNLRDLIEKVQGALVRIDDGSFGRCQACGGAIEAERLDALPYTTLCLTDARRRSRAR